MEAPLASPRLLLRPWTEADRRPFAEMSFDSEVMAYLMPLATREATDAWIDRQRAHLADNGFCFWAVESASDKAFIGAVGLYRIGYVAHFTPAVEIGWRLARKFWGYGYAREAAVTALQFGFVHLGLPEIVAITVPDNIRSQRTMLGLGMSRDAADDFDHPVVPDGHRLRRHVLYRLRRDDWLRLQTETR